MSVELGRMAPSPRVPIELFGRLTLTLDGGQEIDLGRTMIVGDAHLDIPEGTGLSSDEEDKGEPEVDDGDTVTVARCTSGRYVPAGSESLGPNEVHIRCSKAAGHDRLDGEHIGHDREGRTTKGASSWCWTAGSFAA